MLAKRNVLIITYYWPPAGGSGVQRWLKFAKYLHEFGWNPIILTTKNGSYPMLDPSLEQDIHLDTIVYKTKSLEYLKLFSSLSKKKEKSVSVGMIGLKESKSIFNRAIKFIRANLFIPDARLGWKKYAIEKGKQIIKDHKIEAIITTGPPHSAHLIGLALQSHFKGPWIADFRDPWVDIYYNKDLPRTQFTKRKDKQFQDKVIASATKVIVVARGLQDDLELEKNSQKFHVIYNGYDETDTYKSDSIKSTSYFTLAHIGNFIPNYNISTLWHVLSELVEEDSIFKKHFKLRFTGVVDDLVLLELKNNNLFQFLEIENYIPHKLATERMFESCMLLFIVPQGVTNKYIISGKIFEYLASTSPILALGPEDGEAAQVLIEAERNPLVDYGNKDLMKSQIKQYFDYWIRNNNIPFKYSSTNYTKFSRRELTRELALLLDSL